MSSLVSAKALLRAAIAAAGLALLALAIPASGWAATSSFGSGHLDWGVKESFRNYIVGPIAHGSYTTAGGAAKLGDGRIRFPLLGGTYDDAAGVGEFTLDGSVRFEGHGGVLDTTFANLCVRLAGGGIGTLYANVNGKDRDSGAVERRYGVALADLSGVPAPTAEAETLTWPSIAASLSESGMTAFDQYPAGDPLDPLAPLLATAGAPRPRPDGGGCVGVAPAGGGGGGGGGTGDGDGDGPPGGSGPNGEQAGRVVGVAKAVTVKLRVVRIASLRCGAAACRVTTPATTRLWIKTAKGKRIGFRVGVLAPKRLGARATGKLKVRLGKRAFSALAGRRGSVKLKVTIKADGSRTAKTVKATLKRPRG